MKWEDRSPEQDRLYYVRGILRRRGVDCGPEATIIMRLRAVARRLNSMGLLPPKLESVFCRFMLARRGCDPMETVEKAIDQMEIGAPSRGRDLMWLFTINQRQRVPHIELVASGAYVDWPDAIKASRQAKSALKTKTVTHASHRLFKLEPWEQ